MENLYLFKFLRASVKRSLAVMILGRFSANGIGHIDIIEGTLISEGY